MVQKKPSKKFKHKIFLMKKFKNDVSSCTHMISGFIMDVLLNGLSISAKKELQLLCCMMGKTMSLRCHFLAANGWRLID